MKCPRPGKCNLKKFDYINKAILLLFMQHYYYLLIEKIQIYSKTYTAVEQKLNDF
jgi:hypothetical protein